MNILQCLRVENSSPKEPSRSEARMKQSPGFLSEQTTPIPMVIQYFHGHKYASCCGFGVIYTPQPCFCEVNNPERSDISYQGAREEPKTRINTEVTEIRTQRAQRRAEQRESSLHRLRSE